MNDWKAMYQDVLRFCRNNEKYVKIAAVALVVIAALVFFGTKGESEEIVLKQGGENVESIEHSGEEKTGDTPEEALIMNQYVVDISGCVKKPGVYQIEEGARLYQLIELAGGLTKEADTEIINQAEVLFDGQKVLIPEKSSADGSADDKLPAGITSDGKINLNLADEQTLQEIPGVGPATAEKILTYRENHGRFSKIEDIQNVDGIGAKTFEKIKDMITV